MNRAFDLFILWLVYRLLKLLDKRMRKPISWVYSSPVAQWVHKANRQMVTAREYIKTWNY